MSYEDFVEGGRRVSVVAERENAQLHERVRELEEKLTKAAITATRTREEWRAWLDDDYQHFPSPEFLDSIVALIESVGVNADVDDGSAEDCTDDSV